jgi:hypothetical protein
MLNLKIHTMNRFVNNTDKIWTLLSFFVLFSPSVMGQAQQKATDIIQLRESQTSVYKEPDTTVNLPLYIIKNGLLKDSIELAIKKLENNWNYNETYGYLLKLGFATFDDPDSLLIEITVRGIRNVDPLVTSRPLKIINIIGCARVNGYTVIIDALQYVSPKELSQYIDKTGDSVCFELDDCGSIRPFYPWPFHMMRFKLPLQYKDDFIYPDEWKERNKKRKNTNSSTLN